MPTDSLTTTVVEIKNGSVGLKTANGQIINWPKTKMEEVKLGQTVYLSANTSDNKPSDQHSNARDMLNQLLGKTS